MIDTHIQVQSVSTADALQACHAIRHAVFVVEQGVPVEFEKDAWDAVARHYLARRDGRDVGTARVVVDASGTSARISRVAVLAGARNAGIGQALMRAILQDPALEPLSSFVLAAQVRAVTFYERLGFRVFGEPFETVGLPHRSLQLTRKPDDR